MEEPTRPGPPLAPLCERLARFPSEYQALNLDAGALAHRTLTALGGEVALGDVRAAVEATRSVTRKELIALACWLFEDAWFAQARAFRAAALPFLGEGLDPFAKSFGWRDFAKAGEPRELLVRLALAQLGLHPDGEDAAAAAARLALLQDAIWCGGTDALNPPPGTRIWHGLVLVEPIADHGKGPVWLARGERDEVPEVVVRLLPPQLLRDDAAAEELWDAVRRVERDGGVHGTSALLGYEVERRPCLVSRHMRGPALSAELARRRGAGEGPFDAAEALRCARFMADTLSRLHRRDLAHGAVSPSNVLLSETGGFVLPTLKDALVGAVLTRWQLRRPGAPRGGTAGCMAPEVLAGAAPDARADAYSLAATLASMLGAGSPAEVPPGVSPRLGDMLRAAWAADPAARPAWSELTAVLAEETMNARVRGARRNAEAEGRAAAPEPPLDPAAFAWLAAIDAPAGAKPEDVAAATSPPVPLMFRFLTGLVDAFRGDARTSPPRAAGGATLREVRDGSGRAVMDLTGQVLRLEVPERQPFADELKPVLDVDPGSFVSAAVLAQKAKQFDDGLYAAVELAAQRGLGKLGGKSAMLASACARVAADAHAARGDAGRVLAAAGRLGGGAVAVHPEASKDVEATIAEFMVDEARSRPLGFYPWTPELAAIFRQDRMLQTGLHDEPAIRAVAAALAADPGSRAAYEGALGLASRLTNALTRADLRTLLDRPGAAVPSPISILPPSTSHENELAERLLKGLPPPPGFSLIDELVGAVQRGELSLAPRAGSGWYDHQTWALDALLRPDACAEAPRLSLDASYRAHLVDVFKGLLALTRETHVKQLETYVTGRMGESPRTLEVRPALTLEPLPTFYLRRAASYRFVRAVLEDAFGPAALREMRRLAAPGPVPVDLDRELRGMELLFAGAHACSSMELGAPVDGTVDAPRALGVLLSWRRRMHEDPDLARDARMMVPVGIEPGGIRVWAFLGWTRTGVEVSYARPPAVRECDPGLRLEFSTDHHWLPRPVTAELVVPRLLDRAEFRALCDELRNAEVIKRALS